MDRKPLNDGLSSHSSNDFHENDQEKDISEDVQEDVDENGQNDLYTDVQQDVTGGADRTSNGEPLVGEGLCLSPVASLRTSRQRSYDVNEPRDLYQGRSFLRGLYSELTLAFPEADLRHLLPAISAWSTAGRRSLMSEWSILDHLFQQFGGHTLMISSVFPEANRRHLLLATSALPPLHGSNRMSERLTLDVIFYEFPEASRRDLLPATSARASSHRRNWLGEQRHLDRVCAPFGVLSLINYYSIQQITSPILFTDNGLMSNFNSLVPVRLVDTYALTCLRVSTGYTSHPHRCSCNCVVLTGDASFAGSASVPEFAVNERESSLSLVSSDNSTTSSVDEGFAGSALSWNDDDSSLPLASSDNGTTSPVDEGFAGPELSGNDDDSSFPLVSSDSGTTSPVDKGCAGPELSWNEGYSSLPLVSSGNGTTSPVDEGFAGPELSGNDDDSSLPLVSSDNDTTSPVNEGFAGSQLSWNEDDSSLPLDSSDNGTTSPVDEGFAGSELSWNDGYSSLPLVSYDSGTTSTVDEGFAGSELSWNDGYSSLPLVSYASNVASINAHFTGPVSVPQLGVNDGHSLLPFDSPDSRAASTGEAGGFAGLASLPGLPMNDNGNWENEPSNVQAGYYHQFYGQVIIFNEKFIATDRQRWRELIRQSTEIGDPTTRIVTEPQMNTAGNFPDDSSTRSSVLTQVEGRCSGRGLWSWLSFTDGHHSFFGEPNENCSFHRISENIAVSFMEAQFYDVVQEVRMNRSPLAQETTPATRSLSLLVQERSDRTSDVNLRIAARREDHPLALPTDVDLHWGAFGLNEPHFIATDVVIHGDDEQEDLNSLGVHLRNSYW